MRFEFDWITQRRVVRGNDDELQPVDLVVAVEVTATTEDIESVETYNEYLRKWEPFDLEADEEALILQHARDLYHDRKDLD